MTEVADELRVLINDLRTGHHKGSVPSLFQAAQKRGIHLTYAHVREFMSRQPHKDAPLLPPNPVLQFILSAINDIPVRSVLDPWAGVGLLLDTVTQKVIPSNAYGLSPNVQDIELAKAVSQADIRWLAADPLQALDDIPAELDLVVCVPPFGVRGAGAVVIKSEGNEVTIRGDKGLQAVLKACFGLSAKGVGFAVIPPRFFFDDGPNSARAALPELSLYLDAAFFLPPGTFSPYTTIPAYLVVLRRHPLRSLFVAELDADTDIQRLVAQWGKREEAPTPELGSLTVGTEFRSFPHHVRSRRLQVLVERQGLVAIPMSKVALEIHRARKNLETGFEQRPNSVYLPLIGPSRAVSNLSELKLKPHNYAQIVLDPDVALADYVARFFSTEAGLLVRDSLTRGMVIPKISLGALRQGTVYLPPVNVQIERLRLMATLTDVKSEVAAIEQELWERPERLDAVRRALERLSSGNQLEAWMYSLPFPIASILARYDATADVRLKEEHLFHFFEAISQYLVVFFLSGLLGDIVPRGGDPDPVLDLKDVDALKTSSFGAWTTLGTRLAKQIRKRLSDTDKRESTLRRFRQNRAWLLDTLCAKRIYEVLRVATDYRNEWKGHGGIESDVEASRRVVLLEAQLAKFRESVPEGFHNTVMVRPKVATYFNGVFKNIVEVIMGTRTLFKEWSCDTTDPMDSGKLYLLEEGNVRGLALVPLLRMGSTPKSEESACYFYNRLQKNTVRWVSYHFEKEAELVDDSSALRDFFQTLEDSVQRSPGY